MKEYQIEIIETLERIIPTKANSYEEALEKVRKKYDSEEIVLDADDFCEVNMV